MSTVTLRDFQTRAVTKVLDTLAAGRRSVCLVAPTGAGKTVMAAASVQDFVRQGKRVLFVAHRIELVEQAVARLGVPCGMIVAGSPRSMSMMPVVVASLQTLARRLDSLPPFDIVVVDEAHHIMSNSYQKLLERCVGARIVGLTATPTRLDGRPLGEVFDELVIAANVSELIDKGYLVRPRVFTTPVEPDVRKVKKTAGDFNEQQLELACNKPTLRGDIVRHWLERCPGSPTVLFAVSLQHSVDLVEDFGRAGVSAVHVDGSMPRPKRDAALEAIRSGEAKVLCNVGIVTEGWDFPQLEGCVLARPTQSLSLLLQMVGRVMRPHAEKQGALVLDHAGNFSRHKVLPWSDIDWLDEIAKSKEKLEPIKTCPRCYALMEADSIDCAQCGYFFARARSSDDGGDGREVKVDTTVQLQEVTSMQQLMIDEYLQRRDADGKPLTPYLDRLVKRTREGAVREDFWPYIIRAKGAIGVAARTYKEAIGRWP